MSLRSIVATHRPAFAALFAAALLLRLLVPSGFMPMLDGARIVLAFCPSGGEGAMPMPAGHAGMGAAMHHSTSHGGGAPADKHDAPCAYAGLALSMLDTPEAALVAAALAFAFVLALLLAARRLPPRAVRWRPPLRAPPLSA